MQKICESDNCSSKHTTPCISTDYLAGRFSFKQYLPRLGFFGAIRHVFTLRKNGWCDFPAEYYCPDHAYQMGYCWGCGYLWAGCEDFDFHPSRLCSNCRSEIDQPEDDDYDDEWGWMWEHYPGECLADNVDFIGAEPA